MHAAPDNSRIAGPRSDAAGQHRRRGPSFTGCDRSMPAHGIPCWLDGYPRHPCQAHPRPTPRYEAIRALGSRSDSDCSDAALDACRARFEAPSDKGWGDYALSERRSCTRSNTATATRLSQRHCYQHWLSRIIRDGAVRDYLCAHPHTLPRSTTEKRSAVEASLRPSLTSMVIAKDPGSKRRRRRLRPGITHACEMSDVRSHHSRP